jgi:hypothetical protein
MVDTYGPSTGNQDGRVVYSDGSVLVTYSDSLAIRVTFELVAEDLSITAEEAGVLVDFYRPPDAQLLSNTALEPGLVRRVYSSAALATVFAGSDTGGRPSDRYVEELRFDPATQQAISIEMALGDQP